MKFSIKCMKNDHSQKFLIVLFAILAILLSLSSYIRNGIWKSRVDLWEDVIRKSPCKARAYNNAGVNYCKQKQYDQALRYSSKAIFINPRYTDALITRGNVYDEIGEPYRAIADYTSALLIDPDDSYAYYNRAQTYSRMGRTEDARSDYRKACELGLKAGCGALRIE